VRREARDQTHAGGCDRFAGADPSKIVEISQTGPRLDGDGHRSERIVAHLEDGP
jgi:hypothetical protein